MFTQADNKTVQVTQDATGSNDTDRAQPETLNEDDQRGVQGVEAVTLTWTKASLVAVFLK